MTTEIFQGNPDQLKARLDAIIAGPGTINFVIETNIKGAYLIIWT